MNKPILIKDLGTMYPTETSKAKERYGIYECPYCKKHYKTQTTKVKNNRSKSCGCYQKKRASETQTTHGKTKHKIYQVWNQMMIRCYNKKSISYKNYGLKGIKVCERWMSVENFIGDMYPTYKEGLSIDRIDVNGNYEKSNCRWTTKTIQSQNTRKIRKNNLSGYRGVYFRKDIKKYRASITVNKKTINLGNFQDKIEAAKAYDQYVINNNLEHTTNGLYT